MPSGYTAVLRDLELFNGSGETLSLTNVETGPGTPSVLFWLSGALPTDTVARWEGRVVLNAGDVVQLFGEYDGLHVTLSGYLLSSS